jgi:hypothetical protein
VTSGPSGIGAMELAGLGAQLSVSWNAVESAAGSERQQPNTAGDVALRSAAASAASARIAEVGSAGEVAAVNGELGASDVDGVVGGEEGDGGRDLLGFGAAAERGDVDRGVAFLLAHR